MVDRGRGEMKPTAGRLASNCTALQRYCLFDVSYRLLEDNSSVSASSTVCFTRTVPLELLRYIALLYIA
jgi:hypothetical protein